MRPCCAGRTNTCPRAVRDDAIAGRREVRGGHPVHRGLHPALAQLIEVGDERDRDGLSRRRSMSKTCECRRRAGRRCGPSDSEGDWTSSRRGGCAAAGRRRPSRHRPDVHGAVAVAGEVDAVRSTTSASCWCRRKSAVSGVGLAVAGHELPEVLRGAAPVAPRVAPLEREPREEERAARRVVGAVARLRERQDARVTLSSGSTLNQLRRSGGSRSGAVAVEDLPGRRPADDERAPAVVASVARAPRPRAAACRPRSAPRTRAETRPVLPSGENAGRASCDGCESSGAARRRRRPGPARGRLRR